MGWPSFKELCEKRLRLDLAGKEVLKAAARTILTERDNWFREQKERDAQGTYDSDTLCQLAADYIEEGWNTATVELPPGKDLWTSLNVDSGKPVYIYPQDKESIVKGVEKVFAKTQAQLRWKRHAKNRAEKRKHDEDSKSDDDLEMADKGNLRERMTPQSLQKPKRRSDRIKQNTYTTWNFNIEDFRRPATTQAQVGKASSDEDRKGGPQRTSDRHESSAHERDKPRIKSSKRLLWPSTSSLGPHQMASTKPTHSSQKVAILEKIGTAQPVDVAWSSTSAEEAFDRDTLSPDELQPTMLSAALKIFRKPSYQAHSDGIPIGLPPPENTSTSSKVPNAAKSTAKRRAPLVGSKNKYPRKKMRLNSAGQITFAETGPVVLKSSRKEAPSSEGVTFGQNPMTPTKDLGSPTGAVQSLPHCLDNQPGHQEPLPRRSNKFSPFFEDGLSMRAAGSPPKGGTSQVTVTSKNEQNKVDDKAVQVVEPGRSTYTWILQSSHPLKAWVLWPGADLIRANLPSVFAAVVEHAGLTELGSMEIMLETAEKSFTFSTSREDADHFEDMQRFMDHIIETSHREKHDSNMLLNVWISPKEIK